MWIYCVLLKNSVLFLHAILTQASWLYSTPKEQMQLLLEQSSTWIDFHFPVTVQAQVQAQVQVLKQKKDINKRKKQRLKIEHPPPVVFWFYGGIY
mgnify:CR=1 FL=1